MARSKKPFRIAVLASTRGTDLQALIDQIVARKMPGVELALVASDVKECYALERAKEQGFETAWIDPKGKTREEFDAALREVLEEVGREGGEAGRNSGKATGRGKDGTRAKDVDKGVDLVCLMGFMRILSPEFVRHYHHRILNVHPSLLPKYRGKGFMGDKVHAAVLANGDRVTGMTIHFVDEGCDTGPIVHQALVAVESDDRIASLRDKVQALEKKWYPEVIRWIQHGKIVAE